MRAEQAQRAVADGEAGGRRDQRQDDALGDELARDPPLAGAEREPRRELLQPHARSHEHEVRDVDAADQQHEERAAPHQIERRLDVAHQRVLQRIDDGVEAGVDQQLLQYCGNFSRLRGVERVDLLLRQFDAWRPASGGAMFWKLLLCRCSSLFCCGVNASGRHSITFGFEEIERLSA